MTEHNIKAPMVYSAELQSERPLTPIECEMTLSIKPLSTATMMVDREDAPPFHGWVEMFTAKRSAGIFRVAKMTDTIDGSGNVKLSLEHGICVLRDAIATISPPEATYVAVDTRSGTDGQGNPVTPVTYRGTRAQVRAACLAYQAQNPGYTPEWAISTEDNNVYFAGTPEAVLRQILAYQTVRINGQSLWDVGTVTVTDSVKLKVDHDVCLDLLDDLMDALPDCMLTFDQSVFPWLVGIVRRPSIVSAEGRLSRNLTRAEIDYDDSELYTRVYMDDLPNGHLDADTIGTYGIISYYQKAGDALSQQEKLAICQQFLDKHKNPKVSIDIDAVELGRVTGVDIDDVEIGALYRLALPDYNLVIEQHVITMFYSSIYENPGVVMLTLASDANSLVSRLSEMKKAISGGGGSAARDKELEEDAEREKIRYDLKVDYDKKHFQILATEEEWSDAWNDYFLTNKTKFYQDARKFALIATEQAYDDLENGDTTLKEVWDANLELTAQKLNLVFNDTEYADLQQIREDAGQLYADATMFSLLFSHNDLLTIINSRKTMFELTQDTITAEVSSLDGRISQLQLTLDGITMTSTGVITIKGQTVNLGDYVTIANLQANYATISDLDTEKARINAIIGGTATLAGIICNGNISAAGGVSASGVYVGTTDLSTAIVTIGTATESSGQISIPTTRLNGQPGTPINFNIAATNYFQTEVAAAEARGESKFTQATVTPQGAGETVYVPDNTGTIYYTAGMAVYKRGEQISRKTTGYLYDAGGNPVGYGAWFVDSNMNTQTLYRTGDQVTPINSANHIRVKSSTRYAAGTPDSTTYYTRVPQS